MAGAGATIACLIELTLGGSIGTWMPWPLGSCCCPWTRHTGHPGMAAWLGSGDGGNPRGRNSWHGDSAGSSENSGTKSKYLAHWKNSRWQKEVSSSMPESGRHQIPLSLFPHCALLFSLITFLFWSISPSCHIFLEAGSEIQRSRYRPKRRLTPKRILWLCIHPMK